MIDAEILCLSYFDTILGPNIFYCSNNSKLDEGEYPDLQRILEFNEEEGTFIFAFRKYQTINHLFFLPSELARGGKDLLMITYMIKASYFRNEIVDIFKYLNSKTPFLEELALKLTDIDELPIILHEEKSGEEMENLLYLGSNNFREQFSLLFNEYIKKLFVNSNQNFLAPTQRDLKKIFIFGAKGVGKSTFLKNIEAIQFHQQENRDLPTIIYEFVIENTRIISPDCYEKNLECKLCEKLGGCIQNAQGFILIFNASDRNSLIEAKEQFKLVIERCDQLQISSPNVPVLIVGNKFKKNEDVSPQKVFATFNIPNLNECGIIIEYFPINILKGEQKIMKALRWLVKNII
jgi:GTPase SAR1 family protein